MINTRYYGLADTYARRGSRIFSSKVRREFATNRRRKKEAQIIIWQRTNSQPTRNELATTHSYWDFLLQSQRNLWQWQHDQNTLVWWSLQNGVQIFAPKVSGFLCILFKMQDFELSVQGMSPNRVLFCWFHSRFIYESDLKRIHDEERAPLTDLF